MEVSTQCLGHGADHHSVHLVVLKRTGEHDADLALWLDAPNHLFLDDPRRWAHPDILRRLADVERRQAAQITLDQRLDGGEVEAPDKDEDEVAGIREALFVE